MSAFDSRGGSPKRRSLPLSHLRDPSLRHNLPMLECSPIQCARSIAAMPEDDSGCRMSGTDPRLRTRRMLPSAEVALAGSEDEDLRKTSGVRDAFSGSRAEELVCDKLIRDITEYDKKRLIHEESIRLNLSALDSVQINNLRYRLFAPHYDHHMEGHERAIDSLVRQLTDVERIAFSANRLMQGEILEMSCGTGTVIKLISSALGPERTSELSFIANDLSDDMKSRAVEKLRGLPVTFTSQDLNWLSFPSSYFGTIVLSQTLHLITDEDVVRQERSKNYMHIDEGRHIDQKFNAISNAWRTLKDGGTFILVDEWPALLSDRGGPLGPGFAYLFNDGLRQISLEDFQSSIMEQMPGSRFIAQLKAPIDGKHQMHLFVYRKEGRTGNSRIPPSPDHSEARRAATEKLLEVFRTIDRDFIDSLAPSDGGNPWIRLLPIDDGAKVVRSAAEMHAGGVLNNSVVLQGCMHGIDPYDRYELLANSISSLRLGGSLIIIDEWSPPEGISNALRLGSLRPAYMNRFSKHLAFAGSLRVPISPSFDAGMYGFEYRKVF